MVDVVADLVNGQKKVPFGNNFDAGMSALKVRQH